VPIISICTKMALTDQSDALLIVLHNVQTERRKNRTLICSNFSIYNNNQKIRLTEKKNFHRKDSYLCKNIFLSNFYSPVTITPLLCFGQALQFNPIQFNSVYIYVSTWTAVELKLIAYIIMYSACSVLLKTMIPFIFIITQ
jgi:hypothetical protein